MDTLTESQKENREIFLRIIEWLRMNFPVRITFLDVYSALAALGLPVLALVVAFIVPGNEGVRWNIAGILFLLAVIGLTYTLVRVIEVQIRRVIEVSNIVKGKNYIARYLFGVLIISKKWLIEECGMTQSEAQLVFDSWELERHGPKIRIK